MDAIPTSRGSASCLRTQESLSREFYDQVERLPAPAPEPYRIGEAGEALLLGEGRYITDPEDYEYFYKTTTVGLRTGSNALCLP